MSPRTALLERQVSVLAGLESEIPGGVDAIRLARDPDLLAFVRSAQNAVRLAQALVAAAAGELARRSEGDADASLARRCGQRSATGLVAVQAGLPIHEAAQLVAVGSAIRPGEALSGEDLQPKRAHVARAVADGSVSLAEAELIDRTLTKVAHVLWADQADDLEAQLVTFAQRATSFADFRRFCMRIPDRLDPDGAEPRGNDLRARARITEARLPNGLLRIIADLDPELEGWWKTAMAAKTAPRRQAAQPADGATRDDAGSADAARPGAARSRQDRVQPDAVEWKLEALKTILRQAIQADDGQAAGVDVTMLVTIQLNDLLSGIGSATIAGVEHPISAATARRLACQANLVPQVLNGRSVVLDQGIGRRLFSKQQRYALATRDQGCTFPACPLPPGMCEVNHIQKARDLGPSDLDNGVLLCGWHNRLMEQGWEMHLDRESVPWFSPPSTIDPSRTPIRGGHLRVADVA